MRRVAEPSRTEIADRGPRRGTAAVTPNRAGLSTIRRCRLPFVSDGAHTTRRRFLEASVGAAVTTWLGTRAQAAPPPGGARVLETLPFVGEGSFPLETT